MLTAEQLIQRAYTAFRGKVASKTPAFGSDKANIVLEDANRFVEQWARDADQVWASLYKSGLSAINQPGTVAVAGTTALTGTGTYFTDFNVGDTILVGGETVRTIDTITSDTALTVSVAFSTTASDLNFSHQTIIATGVQEYSLHRNFFIPSKTVIVTTTQDICFSADMPQNVGVGMVYYSGNNPKKVTFYDTIASTSQIVGGTLKIPGIYLPDPLVLSTDIVAVDDPEWLVLIVASELARNDAAKSDQFPNLVAMANERYTKMISANGSIGFGQGGAVPNLMPQIGDRVQEDAAFII